jgi:hypothetical protein
MMPGSPNPPTCAERLDEIAEILAAGLIRMRARMSSQISGVNGEFPLDIPDKWSGHPNPADRRTSDGW